MRNLSHIIVESHNQKTLIDLVNNLKKEGYTPVGNTSVSPSDPRISGSRLYLQAMVLK